MAMQAVLMTAPDIPDGCKEMILSLYRADLIYQSNPGALLQMLVGLLGKEKGFFVWYNYMLVTNHLQDWNSKTISEFYQMLG